MRTIVVAARHTGDYIAYVATNYKMWGCGASTDEAIGALVRAWAGELGLEIKLPEEPA